MKPDISIIIPVYNSAAFVKQTLNSVFAQTHANIEVLCIDGHSTDNSLEILNTYASKYQNLRVFSRPNEGPGPSRNTGLDNASGQYIMFLDSDDLLEPHACKTMLARAKKDNEDLIISNFYIFDDASGKLKTKDTRYILPFKHTLTAADGPDAFVKMAFSYPFVWGKLIKRDIIESAGLRFPKGAVEDVPFSISYAALCKTAVFMDDEYLLYYRVNRGASISSSNERMALDGINNFGVLEENLKKYGVFKQVYETFWFNKMLLLVGDEHVFAGRLGNVKKETVQKAYDIIRPQLENFDPAVFKNRNFIFRTKVKYLLRAVKNNNLSYPKILRKIRNILFPFFNIYYRIFP